MEVHPQIEKHNSPNQSMSMPATAYIQDCLNSQCSMRIYGDRFQVCGIIETQQYMDNHFLFNLTLLCHSPHIASLPIM